MSAPIEQNESTSVIAVCDVPLGDHVEGVLDQAIQAERQIADRINGAVVGALAGLSVTGEPLVDFPENWSGRALAARSTVPIGKEQIGANLVLLFERGDPSQPLVVGVVQNSKSSSRADHPKTVGVRVDDDRVLVTGEREVVLRCGEASITLTRAGKVLIRGTYVLSRSSGANRIKGGSVQIN